MKRSNKVAVFQNKWAVISGHLDCVKPIKEIILEEIREEGNIKESDIKNIDATETIEMQYGNTNKKNILLLSWVHLKMKPKIKLNWENTDYKWVTVDDLDKYEFDPIIIPVIEKIKKHFIKYLEEQKFNRF